MKHITFIAAGLLGGGIEKAYSSLANHLVNNGFRVTVVLLFKSEHFFTLDDKIEFVEPHIDRASMNKYIYAIKIIPYLRSEIRRFKPDVLISYGEWFNPFVIMATRGLAIPLFVSDRMSPTLKLGWLQDMAKKVFYRMSEGIIAQTTYAKEVLYKRTGHNNIKVIPNPVNKIDIKEYTPQNRIVTVGRLSKEKGHKYLIEAFANIVSKDWSLHIVGDGKEREGMEKLVSQLRINDKVFFYGHQKDFKSILATADVFVLPSISEGFPNALIEAMSVPLACISSDCIAGPSDIITQNENGVLVPPADVEALTIALNKLIKQPKFRKSLRDQAYSIRNTLDFSTIANSIIDFIFPEK